MKIDVNYLESKTWVEQDMRDRFRWLRENDPVYWSEKDDAWVITKFADVAYCSKHQELFTSAEGVLVGLPVKLGWIVDKCLGKDPARRYQTAGDLVVDLNQLREDVAAGVELSVATAPATEATTNTASTM